MQRAELPLADNSLIVAFALVGVTLWLSNAASTRLTRGRVHGSAIAIVLRFAFALWGEPRRMATRARLIRQRWRGSA